MNEPIPVQDALKLIELALADCDKAQVRTASPDWFDGGGSAEEPAFTVLARATMRPMLEVLKGAIAPLNPTWVVGSTGDAYPPLAALRDHYSAVRPDWRER